MMPCQEDPMSEVIWLTAFIGMVGATARVLYPYPIQWSDDASGRMGDPVAGRSLSEAFGRDI
jgi:hypothetical protein